MQANTSPASTTWTLWSPLRGTTIPAAHIVSGSLREPTPLAADQSVRRARHPCKWRAWGHSSFDQAMQVAEMAGVKHLALTHHEPDHDDEFLQRIEKLCRERFPNAVLAREGME